MVPLSDNQHRAQHDATTQLGRARTSSTIAPRRAMVPLPDNQHRAQHDATTQLGKARTSSTIAPRRAMVPPSPKGEGL